MKLRGSFVQKLIQFFENIPLGDGKYNEYSANKGKEQTEDKKSEPRSNEETSSNLNPHKTTPAEAKENESKSLPLLHSSVFLFPSLQMLFELVGLRPRQQRNALNIAISQFCYHFYNLSDTQNQPLIMNPSMRRFGCSLDDLIHLNHKCDVLDNVETSRSPCNCRFSTKTKASSEKTKKAYHQHRPTWPAAHSRLHMRRRSADEPAARKTFTTEEETPKVYNLPILTKVLKVEPPTEQRILITEVGQDTEEICKPLLVEPSIASSVATEMEDFNDKVKKTIQEVQSSVSLQLSEQPKKEEKKPIAKTRSNRLKRKLAKMPPTGKEIDDIKTASILTRRRLHQQRLTKKETRRVRHLFRNSINPSIFSQYCATKGDARCTERIEYKSDKRSKDRPVSPAIDTWAILAERDTMLESFFSEPNKATKDSRTSPAPEDTDEVNQPFYNRLEKIEPIVPCCRCSCHYGFVNWQRTDETEKRKQKTDMATEMETRSVDASTQTTSFVSSYDQRGIWGRRKDSRTKSEGAGEKQSTRHNNVTKRFFDFINEQTACVTGNKHQRADEKRETLEFRQFLLSRFLEHSAKEKMESEENTVI